MKNLLTLSLLAISLTAFGQQDTTDLKEYINAKFPNNTSRVITPLRLREVAIEQMRSSPNKFEENILEESLTVTDSIYSDNGFFKWDGTSYVEIGQSTPTLNSVLFEGNTTDGRNINISDGDAIYFDNGSRIRKGITDMSNGGAKGVALVCSIDYELKWEAGRLYILHQDGFTIREVRYNFTITPNENDDATKGFVIGSKWVMDDGLEYVCADSATGAAVWDIATLWAKEDGVIYPNNTDTVEANYLRSADFRFGSDSVYATRYVDEGLELNAFIVEARDGSLGGFTFGIADGNESSVFSISSNVFADVAYPEVGSNYQGWRTNYFADGANLGNDYHTRLYMDTLGANWYNNSPYGSIQVRIDSAAAFLVTGAMSQFTLNDSLTVDASSIRLTGDLKIQPTGFSAADGDLLTAINGDGEVEWRTPVITSSGTYTPSTTNMVNIASTTTINSNWSRVGNIVTVAGYVSITTSGNGLAQLGLSLPVASNFTTRYEGSGTFTTTEHFGEIYSHVSNDNVVLEFQHSGSTGADEFRYVFVYEIL